MAKKIGKLAYRYARAFRSTILEELGDTHSSPTPSQLCADSLEAFASLWQSRELQAAMLNPMFSKEDRRKVVVALARQIKAPEIVERFLSVLVDRDRLLGVVEICTAFREEINRSLGVVEVVVQTARSVSDSEKAEIQAMLGQKIKGDLSLSWEVDPTLIGGMVLRYQGNVLDGSIKGRLERLEGELQAA